MATVERSPPKSPPGSPGAPESPGVHHTARYGPTAHVVYHAHAGEPERTYRLRQLVRPPLIRQWLDGGKLYREPAPREVPRFELFFDLLFVAIIHQLADAAIEEPSGDAVARFILTFWPSWSIWEEACRYSNVSGSDDLLHRVWVLVGMGCLLGYSANASAIELHPAEGSEGLDSTAVHAAVAFWLIIKLTRVLVLFFYAYRLPDFRLSQFLGGLAVLVPMFVYLPLVWVKDRHVQIVLATLGIVVDLLRIDATLYALAGRYIRRRARLERKRRASTGEAVDDADDDKLPWFKMARLPPGVRIPAVNIEHSIERNSAFVVIVLGELVMNLLYNASAGSFGASSEYGRAVLGLMVAWALNWLYLIPSDINNEYEHGLRRSFLTAISFVFMHWPLCASLVLASAASGRMVLDNDVEVGVQWYWGCGLGFAVLFMSLIDATHRNLAPMHDSRVARPIRCIFSLCAALALILLPLGADRLSSVAILAISVGIIWTLLVVQVIGILPRPSRWVNTPNGWVRRGAAYGEGAVEEQPAAEVPTTM